MRTRELYQKLYDETDYGQASAGRCPGVRYLYKYHHHLWGEIWDFGCGNGDTVRELRRLGHDAYGIDQISSPDMIQGDISERLILKPPSVSTALCIDVLEHLTPEELGGVVENLKQFWRQVVTVHAGSDFNPHVGEELHILQMSAGHWFSFLSAHFEIVSFERLELERFLFLMTKKR